MGNFRNAFSRGDPFADRPTRVHSRNDGRRPTDSAKTWAHPDTQCEGERVSAASLWFFFRCRFKRDELMQMANLAGDKSWPGRRGGTFQLSFLSAAFVLAVRTRRLGDVANRPVLLPLPFLLPLTLRANSLCPPRADGGRLLFHAHYGNRSLRPWTRPCCSTMPSWSPHIRLRSTPRAPR